MSPRCVYALQGDTAKAKSAYQDFLTLWKDADPDSPNPEGRSGVPDIEFVYVFKDANDRFYRVLVGPFGDADSAAEVKCRLEMQGFEAIRQPWSQP